jgi:TetR/AcrR family transcriptional repressor of nem operon
MGVPSGSALKDLEEMRKSRQEAAETRARIVSAASEEFRRNGIGATGLSDLMAAAGLTHGGFYRHFGSKDELVAEACASAAEMLIATVGQDPAKHPDENGLDAMVEDYLSTDHRDDPSAGCPFASLGSEIGRGGNAVRDMATDGFTKLVDTIAAQIAKTDPDGARKEALTVVSTMVGALTMARMVNDPALSDEILEQAKTHLSALSA